MNTAAFLESLAKRGIELRPHPSGRPAILAKPASKLTDKDRILIRRHKDDLLALFYARREAGEINLIAQVDGWRALPRTGHAAYSIVETCQHHGVALRIDDVGVLVVGKAGARADEATQPWPALLAEIEGNLEAVARLVESGWHLRADFPKGGAA